ncbi:class I SAM-dependent methyltransferase [Streptosporangium roseum]|uniref:Methyltransferase type 11 n=1 Tax=Streptosporangium roseum (strain ATCC 12428 / DSM 43021 / JCM 3005 / KCTC 9067 / NCIMB 10171 / NRRL 2505 / NI 9100) TaxID=479432 RepID=D2B3Z0_STRRD|nr:methyltransferase domain-containing protein [Streptosporangium roseum]ACZ91224.1 methyltransferase type 11 [Streptosporangium roseum DSM 43021]
MRDLAALDRIRELLIPVLPEPTSDAGYLDLLGEKSPAGSPAQRLMRSGFLPRIYERFWRPALIGAMKGPLGPDTGQEEALVRAMLALGPADLVLDVACGPGNITRALARDVDDGLVVGIDASATMLARAVRDTPAGHIGYVRGDAVDLPFRPASFDAVCCLAALYLFDRPFEALAGMARVLRPGGRIALLTTRRLPLAGPVNDVAGAVSGVRMFGDREVTGALARLGFSGVRQKTYGLMQFVSGRLT